MTVWPTIRDVYGNLHNLSYFFSRGPFSRAMNWPGIDCDGLVCMKLLHYKSFN